MLREWGQIELDRGDRQAAEQRWAEILDVVLPAPSKKSEPRASARAAKYVSGTFFVAGRKKVPDTYFALAAPTPAPVAPPPRKAQAAVDLLVPGVTNQQFDRAAEVAKLAAERKMFALSLRAVRDALRGGPPVSGNSNFGRRRNAMVAGGVYSLSVAGGGSSLSVADDAGQHSYAVANQLSELVARWRRGGVPESDIYDALADVVLPAARPAEVFLYTPDSGADPSQPGNSVGRLLAEAAKKADRLDDLRQRVASRKDKPLGELNARVLLAQVAWVAGDNARLGELLQEFEQSLHKDNLRHTADLLVQVAAPALSKPELAPTALPVLERAAKNLIAAGAEDSAMNVLLFLARHDFEHGKTKEGRTRLKEVTALGLRNLVGKGGQSQLVQQMQNVVRAYIRAGLLGDALDLLGMVVDLPAEQQAQVPRDALNYLVAGFARQFDVLPAPRRYELLKSWTLPTLVRRSVRVLGGFVPTEAPPAAFGKYRVPRGGVLNTPDLLIEAARDTGKLDELAAEVQQLAAKKVENADTLHALIQIARGQGASVEDAVKQHLERVRKTLAAPPPVRSPYYYPGQQNEGPQVEWTDYLLARACLSDAHLSAPGHALADALLSLAQRSRNWSMLIHLRENVAQSRLRSGAKPQASGPRQPELKHWHPGNYESGAARPSGTLPAWWVAHEGHVAHLLGPDHQFLLYDYPLTGSFEFSVDAYHGGWAEGHMGYAGMVFEPNPTSTSRFWPVGAHEQIYLLAGALHHDTFNRFTVQVEPGKLRWLVNGRLVHEQTDPSPTSPWLALFASRERHTVFRNPQIRGTPQVPREVRLSHGDRLEGWVSSFYQDSQPTRLNKQADSSDEEETDIPNRKRELSSFDWYSREGEIHGRHARDLPGREGVGSLLSYFRPLRSGETLRYEFFYRPGEVMVYPALGRLAFLLGPERMRLHWLGENDGNDWTGLATDNAVEAADGRAAGPLPFKANEWNRLQVSLTADGVKLELNGATICEQKLEPDNARTFGLFHYKNRTAVQVRNVVLTGDWPAKLSDKELADPLVAAGPVTDGAIRRALIGEKFFLLNADHILRQARALPDEKAFELLAAWVLPGEGHSVFQMAGEFTPADPAPPVAPKPLPSGRRVQTGGELEAPALELVRLAKKLGKLAELAKHVEHASDPRQARGRLAMQVLVWAAQERDEPARTALDELTRWIAARPLDEPTWRRWPELVAAKGAMSRPALRAAALALLETQVKQMEEGIVKGIPLPSRDQWIRHVKQARAAIQVLRSPPPRHAFGEDPGLLYWNPVSHNWAMPRGIGSPKTHWAVEDGGVVKHYPGRAQDYLYLRMPLRGDFEVSCELTSFGWREMRLAYGGLRFDLLYTLKSYNLNRFSERIRVGDLVPPLPAPGPWYKFRLVVRGATWTVFVNDRKMCEEWLLDDADPWLMLLADHQLTAGVRDLKITGRPQVPQSLSLSALPDLTGWRSYDSSGWQKRGDTIVSHGSRAEPRGDRPPPPRTWQEQALHYHRPLLEDGEIEYDFFYEPDKVHGHPALDRLVFLLDPEGVRIHWLTDGVHDRTGLSLDNATTEPNNRRGPAALPLKPKAWNHLKLSLTGDTVTLHLNGVEVYQRVLESTNQRTFGLFHYADDTTIRVRNVTYRGQWPRQVPDEETLWAVKDAKK